MISLTQEAVIHIKNLLQDDTDALGIRIGVKTKGCSGLSWTLDYCYDDNGFDEKIEVDGIKFFIDPKAVLFVVGLSLDYQETDIESGFVFINPNEKGKCGCGESFYV